MKTYQIPFKAYNGDELCVYIGQSFDYENAVTLKGADEPFVTEMDDDDDLFTPARIQTGYVRFIDETGDTLRDVLPQRENLVYVRIAKLSKVWDVIDYTDDDDNPEEIYGWVTVRDFLWYGFVQAQFFTQPWTVPPFEVELPVIDYLAALGNYDCVKSQNLRRITNSIHTEFHGLLGYSAFLAYTNSAFSREQDLQNYVYDSNWLTWDDDTKDFETVTSLEKISDITAYFGWTCVCHRNILYFVAPDASEKIRRVPMSKATLLPEDIEEQAITIRRIEDYQIMSDEGSCSLFGTKKKISIIADANVNNSEIFQTDWPGKYNILGGGTSPAGGSFGVPSQKTHYWHSFRTQGEGFKIECFQYNNGSMTSSEVDIIYNNITYGRYTTGCNLIYDTVVTPPDKKYGDDGMAARLLFSALNTTLSSQLALRITSRDAYDFGPRAALLITGKIKISKNASTNFVDEDWDTAYVGRIPITIKVGTTSFDSYINIDSNGDFTTPVGQSTTYDWLSVANGTLIQFSSYVQGVVTIEIKTPVIRHTNASSSLFLPYIAFEGFGITRVQPYIVNSALYYDQKTKYDAVADTRGSEDHEVKLYLSSAPNAYMGIGLGIVRNSLGQPTSISINGKKAEESLLQRMKDWYSVSHEILTITIAIDYEIKPSDKFTWHNETYYILSINYQWRDSAMTLKLIKK